MNCEALLLISYCVLTYAQYNGIGFNNNGKQTGCVTPDLEKGRCISIQECPPLLNMVAESSRRPEVFSYLQQSHCGFSGKSPKVCCPVGGTPGSQTPGNPPTPAQPTPASGGPLDDRNVFNHPNLRLLPENCGLGFSKRIIGGEEVAPGEYPWMAILEYTRKTNGGKVTLCGGVLINGRYVLTAAHCIYGDPQKYKLTGVILGEHNTATNPDCQMNDFGVTICQPAPITVGVESAVMHPDYQPSSTYQKHDIGLIRLSRTVSLEGKNDFRAICFPRDELITKNYVGETVVAAGWGRTETSRSGSDILLDVRLPVVDVNDCANVYAGRRQVGPTQICAGGQPNKDSCRGDSGGPLMAPDSLARNSKISGRLFVVGVVSYGPDPCGKDGWPGVYTRVGEYANWILDSMRD